MPDVDLELEIRAPVERVWEVLVDIERYPASMGNVRWVKLVSVDSPTLRHSAWSVTLKGAILEWEEREELDPVARTMEFHQISGDLEVFDGVWKLVSTGDESTSVSLTVTFEIGIPLLADMLNPIAQKSLRENCTEMLFGIERDSLPR